MADYHAVTLGLPESGKTAYLSCAMSYLVRYDDNWQLQDANRDFLNMMNETEDILRSGAWPDKTRSNNKLEFKVGGDAVTVTDWMGEMFEALDDFEAYRDCSKDMKIWFKITLRTATHLLIFIDGTTIQNNDTTKRIQRCLSGLQLMLEKFHKTGAKSKKIAFIVTKCDELTGIAPYCDSTGEVSVELLSQSLQKNFWAFFRYIKNVESWLSHEVYSVSCLPVKDHRRTTLEHGLVATNNWTLEDLKGQVAPITNVYLDIELNRWSWSGMLIGGLIGALIGMTIGSEIGVDAVYKTGEKLSEDREEIMFMIWSSITWGIGNGIGCGIGCGIKDLVLGRRIGAWIGGGLLAGIGGGIGGGIGTWIGGTIGGWIGGIIGIFGGLMGMVLLIFKTSRINRLD